MKATPALALRGDRNDGVSAGAGLAGLASERKRSQASQATSQAIRKSSLNWQQQYRIGSDDSTPRPNRRPLVAAESGPRSKKQEEAVAIIITWLQRNPPGRRDVGSNLVGRIVPLVGEFLAEKNHHITLLASLAVAGQLGCWLPFQILDSRYVTGFLLFCVLMIVAGFTNH